jgi:hypothetical protein
MPARLVAARIIAATRLAPEAAMPIFREHAMREVIDALQPVFGQAATLEARDDAPNIMVNMGRGRTPISVRFSTAALDRYMRDDNAFRDRARRNIVATCQARMRDYREDAGVVDAFIIHAALPMQDPDEL